MDRGFNGFLGGFLGVTLINGGSGGVFNGFLGVYGGFWGFLWGFLKELERRASNCHKIMNF